MPVEPVFPGIIPRPRLVDTGLQTVVGSDEEGRVTLRLRYEQDGQAHTTEPFAVLLVDQALAFAQGGYR